MQTKTTKSLQKAGVFLGNKLTKVMPVDTTALRNSITTEVIGKNKVRVGSNLIQAYILEEGREPWKMPNFDAMVWRTIRKFGLDWLKTRWYDEQPSKTKSAIYWVARKIWDEWIKAKHTFSKIWNVYKNKVQQVFLYHMKK